MTYAPTVSPTSRRTFVYWLLLLLPTLGAGTGAIFLLGREQSRLADRRADADEARRAAIAARARLIAENVELLVGDVEAGLLNALAAAPTGDIDRFLKLWEENNPFVRVAFRAAVDGRVLRPDRADPDAAARAFLDRFSARLRANPPWVSAAPEPDEIRKEAPAMLGAMEREEVASNVAQVQSARRDVQQLLRSRDYSAGTEGALAVAPSAPADTVAGISRRLQGVPKDQVALDDAAVKPAARRIAAEQDAFTGGAPTEARTAAFRQAAPTPRGWRPWWIDGRLHLLGWLRIDGGDIAGVELDLPAVSLRFRGADRRGVCAAR